MKTEQERRARAERLLRIVPVGSIVQEWERVIDAMVFFAALAREEAIEETLVIYERGFERNRVVQDVIDEIRSLRAPAATVRLPSPMPDGGKDESYIASGIFSPPGLKAMAGAPAAKEEHAGVAQARAADQDPPASPAPDRAALVYAIKVRYGLRPLDMWMNIADAADFALSVLRERAAEQGEAECLERAAEIMDARPGMWARGVSPESFSSGLRLLASKLRSSQPSAPQATGTSTGEPSCPTCGATSREDKLGQFCSNAYHAPAQPTPDVFERFGEQCGRDWVAACERHEEGRTGTQRIGDAARARFGPLVEALEWYRDQTDTPGMARAALARLRQEGG